MESTEAERIKKVSFFDESNPFALFDSWMKEAWKAEPNDANAMSLATVDADGMPNVRMVLLKGIDERGFVFYTNYESAKGQELLGQKKAAVCFHWKSLRRQIRIRGDIQSVSDEEADTYYNSRDRGSRIGAWASRQSRPMSDRFELEREVAKKTARYAIGAIPRPSYWSGFRIIPVAMEFWRDKPFRLHDRRKFTRANLEETWASEQLLPASPSGAKVMFRQSSPCPEIIWRCLFHREKWRLPEFPKDQNQKPFRGLMTPMRPWMWNRPSLQTGERAFQQ